MRAILVIPLIIICFELNFYASSNQYFYLPWSVKQDSLNYKVYRIDSINSYYIIYVKKGQTLYKIVSQKKKGERVKNCNKIIINNFYEFHLHSMLFVNGHSSIPANQKYEISGWRIDDSTTIAFEGDSIRDLYYADNIKGLCIVKKK